MVILRTPNCPIVLSLGNRVRLRKQSARTHGLMVLGFFVLLFNCPCVMWCGVCGWFAVSISHSHTLIHFIALKCAFDLLRRIWRRYLFMHPKYRREARLVQTLHCITDEVFLLPFLWHAQTCKPCLFQSRHLSKSGRLSTSTSKPVRRNYEQVSKIQFDGTCLQRRAIKVKVSAYKHCLTSLACLACSSVSTGGGWGKGAKSARKNRSKIWPLVQCYQPSPAQPSQPSPASLVYGCFIEIGTLGWLGHHIRSHCWRPGGGQRTGRRFGDTDNCQWSQVSSVVSRAVAGSCPAPAL